MSDAVGIAIFAKAPIEGFAKTRLIPLLGARRAADLQRRFVEHTVEVALAAKLGPVSVWCTPDCEHAVFASLRASGSVALQAQSGANLGSRMLNTFELLTPRCPVMIIGTDCLVLKASHLRDCASSLGDGADAVFLPTEDGGYALVGAARPLPHLFLDMPWGTERVMPETKRRARQMGLRISEPARLWDIDTPQDYQRALACGLVDRN